MPDIRQSPVLDDCQRADEHPLSFDGRWLSVTGGPANWNFNQTRHLCLSGQTIEYDALIHGITGSATFVSYWTPRSFANRTEVWARSAAGFDLSEGWRLFLNLTLPLTYPLMCGYELMVTANIGDDTWRISKYSPAKSTVATTVVDTPPLANTELCLLRYDMGTLSAWRDNQTDGAAWSMVVSGSDSSFPFGYLGIGTDQDDNNPGWIEFGGGELVYHQEIYRILTRTNVKATN